MVTASVSVPSASAPPAINVRLSGSATDAPLVSGELKSPIDTHVPIACGACASNAPDVIAATIARLAQMP
jgi:hypothetical protein